MTRGGCDSPLLSALSPTPVNPVINVVVCIPLHLLFCFYLFGHCLIMFLSKILKMYYLQMYQQKHST